MSLSRLYTFFLIMGLVFLRSNYLSVADEPKPQKVKKDYSGTSVLMGQLRLLFAAWDLNKDSFLDRAELARAFRGPDAKPYDAKARAGKTDASKCPDYDFLIRLDQDGDGRISRAEFIDWARSYALELKKTKSSQTRVSQLERALGRQTTEAERKKLTAELQDERAALSALRKQMRGLETIEKHLQHPQR